MALAPSGPARLWSLVAAVAALSAQAQDGASYYYNLSNATGNFSTTTSTTTATTITTTTPEELASVLTTEEPPSQAEALMMRWYEIPADPRGALGLEEISAGVHHSLFIDDRALAFATGLNDYGQLGDGTTVDRSGPVQVANLTYVDGVSAGMQHSLFLANNTAWAVGRNNFGQLGDGTTVDRLLPTQVVIIRTNATTEVRSATAGLFRSFFVLLDDTLWAAGEGTYNSTNATNDTNGTNGTDGNFALVPSQLRVEGVWSVAVGTNHLLVLLRTGRALATGLNWCGQLGDGTKFDQEKWIEVPGVANVVSIHAGSYHSAFLTKEGDVYAVGLNGFGQLGDGTQLDKIRVRKVQMDDEYRQIQSFAAGPYHNMMIDVDGVVMSNGDNGFGQLGVPPQGSDALADRVNATKMASVGQAKARSVSAGEHHSLLLQDDGSLWGIGSNLEGQIGGNESNVTEFFQVLIGYNYGSPKNYTWDYFQAPIFLRERDRAALASPAWGVLCLLVLILS